MPSEHRFLIFTHAEVVRAVSEFRKRQQHALPPGSIVKTRFFAEPEVEMLIRVGPGSSGRRVDILIGSEELQASVVFFCVQRKIPLPAMQFTKRLHVVGEDLMLSITNDVDRRGMFLKPLAEAPAKRAGTAEKKDGYNVSIRPTGGVLLKHEEGG